MPSRSIYLESAGWTVLADTSVPITQLNRGFCFNFPDSPQTVKYLQVAYRKAVTAAKVRMCFAIDAPANPFFIPKDGDGDGCVRLLVTRPNWLTTNDPLGNMRWWSNPLKVALTPGVFFEVTVPLNADNWSNVFGQRDAVELAATLAAPGGFGFTFGAEYGGGFGHGIGVQGGAAKFTLKEYVLLP